MTHPIFYDDSGRRAYWVRAAGVATLLLVLLVAGLLAHMVTSARAQLPLRLTEDAARLHASAAQPQRTAVGPWLPAGPSPAHSPAITRPLPVVGFYMPWDAPSRQSLSAHVDRLDWLVPGLATVTGADHRFVYESDPHLHRVLKGAHAAPVVLPMVQNAREDGGWDSAGIAALLASPTARARFADRLTAMIDAEGGRGVMLDLESLPARAHGDYRHFLRELRARFAPRGWMVTIAAPV
ncbi:MAG TPA: polysaccharide deacetylase, partial [Sphingomonas sp.]